MIDLSICSNSEVCKSFLWENEPCANHKTRNRAPEDALSDSDVLATRDAVGRPECGLNQLWFDNDFADGLARRDIQKSLLGLIKRTD